jgi:hypothetical protein
LNTGSPSNTIIAVMKLNLTTTPYKPFDRHKSLTRASSLIAHSAVSGVEVSAAVIAQ